MADKDKTAALVQMGRFPGILLGDGPGGAIREIRIGMSAKEAAEWAAAYALTDPGTPRRGADFMTDPEPYYVALSHEDDPNAGILGRYNRVDETEFRSEEEAADAARASGCADPAVGCYTGTTLISLQHVGPRPTPGGVF